MQPSQTGGTAPGRGDVCLSLCRARAVRHRVDKLWINGKRLSWPHRTHRPILVRPRHLTIGGVPFYLRVDATTLVPSTIRAADGATIPRPGDEATRASSVCLGFSLLWLVGPWSGRCATDDPRRPACADPSRSTAAGGREWKADEDGCGARPPIHHVEPWDMADLGMADMRTGQHAATRVPSAAHRCIWDHGVFAHLGQSHSRSGRSDADTAQETPSLGPAGRARAPRT